MKKLIMVLFFTFSLSSYAVTYSGQGNYNSGSLNFQCRNIVFSFQVTPFNVFIEPGYYDCDNVSGIFLAREFQIVGRNLFEFGRFMGTIDRGRLIIKSPNNPNYELRVNQLNPNEIFISEGSFSRSPNQSRSVSGVIRR